MTSVKTTQADSVAPILDSAHISTLIQIVGIDTLRTIKQTYLMDVNQKLPLLLQAMQTGTLEEIGQLSHALKSASANMGLTALSKTYEAIESASGKDQRENIQHLALTLETLQADSLAELDTVIS